MATNKKDVKLDGSVTINADAILDTIFGKYQEPKSKEEAEASLKNLPTDQLIGVCAIFSRRVAAANGWLELTKKTLLERLDSDIPTTYGSSNVTLGVQTPENDQLGLIEFSVTDKETINTETDKKLPDKIKEEIKNLGLEDRGYVETSERLNNAKLKEAKKAGTLPTPLDSLLTITTTQVKGVTFKAVDK